MLQNVLKARHRQKAQSARLQVPPNGLQHILRMRLVLQEIELHEGIEGSLREVAVSFRKALIDVQTAFLCSIDQLRLMLQSHKRSLPAELFDGLCLRRTVPGVQPGQKAAGCRVLRARTYVCAGACRFCFFRCCRRIACRCRQKLRCREVPHAEELAAAAAHLNDLRLPDAPGKELCQKAGIFCMTELPHGAAASAGPDHVPVVVHRLHGKLHESAVPALAEGEIHSPLGVQLLPGRDVLGAGGHVVKDTEAGQCAAAGNAHAPLRHA